MLWGKRVFANVIKLRILKWGIILDQRRPYMQSLSFLREKQTEARLPEGKEVGRQRPRGARGPQTTECLQPRAARGKMQPPPRASWQPCWHRDLDPETQIPGFWPPELGENTLLMFLATMLVDIWFRSHRKHIWRWLKTIDINGKFTLYWTLFEALYMCFKY